MAERLELLIQNDPILSRIQQELGSRGEWKERRKTELAATINESAKERLWIHHEIRRLRKKFSDLSRQSKTARRNLAELNNHRPKKQVKAEHIMNRRKRLLKRMAIAQVSLERMKQFKKNIK